MTGYFLLYGLPCAQCGRPAHHSEVYLNGVRTVHRDLMNRPCDVVHPASLNRPGRRGSEPRPPHVFPCAPARVRSSGYPWRRPATRSGEDTTPDTRALGDELISGLATVPNRVWVDDSDMPYSDHRALGGRLRVVHDLTDDAQGGEQE
jgi:hypothetical protein